MYLWKVENKTINNKYHLPLLVLIPLVLLAGFFIKDGAIAYVAQGKDFEMGAIAFVSMFAFILGAKAFCYFSTRTYVLNSKLCKVDLGLTLVIVSILFYDAIDGQMGNDFGKNFGIFLSLGIATWVLLQMMIFVDYFLLMFLGDRKK